MDFNSVLPLLNANNELSFDMCKTNEDYIKKIVTLYFSSIDDRLKESTLAVFMAYRDHYPEYLIYISTNDIQKLNDAISCAPPKIIKLRRIAISQLSKVA